MTTKNPKAATGSLKCQMSAVPAPVLMEVGVAMLGGALKYGRHNYREAGGTASVYYDATLRHIMAWWEGEDIDAQGKVHHLSMAIASLVVMRDCIMRDKWTDDRPPKSEDGWMEHLSGLTKELIEGYEKPTKSTCVDEKAKQYPPRNAGEAYHAYIDRLCKG